MRCDKPFHALAVDKPFHGLTAAIHVSLNGGFTDIRHQQGLNLGSFPSHCLERTDLILLQWSQLWFGAVSEEELNLGGGQAHHRGNLIIGVSIGLQTKIE